MKTFLTFIIPLLVSLTSYSAAKEEGPGLVVHGPIQNSIVPEQELKAFCLPRFLEIVKFVLKELNSSSTASSRDESLPPSSLYLTVEEGRCFFEPELRSQFLGKFGDVERCEKLIKEVFSQRFFITPSHPEPGFVLRDLEEGSPWRSELLRGSRSLAWRGQIFSYVWYRGMENSLFPIIGSPEATTQIKEWVAGKSWPAGTEHVMKEINMSPFRFWSPEDAYKAYCLCSQGFQPHDLPPTLGEAIQRDPIYGEVFNDKVFGPPERQKPYFLDPSFYGVGLLNGPFVDQILDCVNRIMGVSGPGDRIVVLGNTPVFVGKVLEFLCGSKSPQDKDYRKIVFFPFSGTPNEEFVTPSRLAHLHGRMNAAGLLDPSFEGTYWFLDVYGAGRGPCFVMAEMLKHAQENQKKLPLVAAISLNEITPQRENSRNGVIASAEIMNGKTGTLTFPSISKPQFSVPVNVCKLPRHGSLDNILSSQRVVPAMGACYWHEAQDSRLTNPPSPAATAMLDYLMAICAHKLDPVTGRFKTAT